MHLNATSADFWLVKNNVVGEAPTSTSGILGITENSTLLIKYISENKVKYEIVNFIFVKDAEPETIDEITYYEYNNIDSYGVINDVKEAVGTPSENVICCVKNQDGIFVYYKMPKKQTP